MGICMLGIDHNQAALDVRAIFSFTKKSMLDAMEELQQLDGVSGCLILSTCNRMELWVNSEKEVKIPLYEWLCRHKGIEEEAYRGCFREREEEEAVYHLFHLACGLKSQILGEDQIITQVNDALAFAREKGYVDSVLEVLFRKAVTAAKKVKTEVSFPHGNISVIHQAIKILKEKGIILKDKTCLVIGNGEMGKASARALVNEEAKVTVTVRQYRHGMVDIPKGCDAIDYLEREKKLLQCDLVISATTSPHYTINWEMLENICLKKPVIFLDLAVPRDIDMKILENPMVTLYDVDDFKVDGKEEKLVNAMEKAEIILQELIVEFYSWRDGHDVVPRIQFVKDEVVNDLNLRLTKVMKNLNIEDEEKKYLEGNINRAAQKVINKLLFGLKDSMEQETFLECMQGLEQLYEG